MEQASPPSTCRISTTTSSSSFDEIWEAISNGNVDQVHVLLDRQEDDLETILRQTNKEKSTLLHFAVKCNQLEIVKVILSAIDYCSKKELIWVSDVDDMTPLALAVKAEKFDIAKAILTHPTSVIIPPNYTNLLMLAFNNLDFNPKQSIEMAKLILNHSKGNPLILYPTFPHLFPELNVPTTTLEHTIPVVVVGDSGAGKSTLIKSLQIQGFRDQLWHFFFRVQNVDEHQAGIIPTVFDSAWIGNVVFYDLSSHREFVHEAILQVRYLSDAVFIVVVNLYNEIDEIAKQIVYWLSFIRYHHEKAIGKATHRPNVIIVGSHFYNPKFGRLGHVERFYHYAYPKARSHIDTDQFNIIAKVLMDCRNSSISNIILRRYLSSVFQRLRVNRPQLPTKCYLLYTIIKQLYQPKNEGAVQVNDLLAELCSDHLHCKMFNNSVDEVLELCRPLSELNLLVLLEDKEEKERSWIIFNSHPLLLKVEEVIFHAEHHGSDGIISRDEITGLFGNRPISKRVDPDLILQLMIHYRYCIGVHGHKIPLSPSLEAQEDHFFFPHLLPEVSGFPSKQQLMFAWSFTAERYHYFMPHFIHHFLLHLSQDPEVTEGEQCDRARRTLMTSFPVVGLELVVHIHSNHTILVSMKLDDESDEVKILSMVKRNGLICRITKILEDIDPNMESNISPVEALIPISGDNAKHYPVIKPPKCQLLFRSVDLQYSTEKIKQAIITRSRVQPIRSAQPLSSVENLLSFEPYFYLDDELRRTLLHPPHPDKTISFDFFESIGLALQLEKLGLLLAAIGINMGVIESLKKDSTRPFSEKLHEAYQHVFGKGVTYKELHQCLDNISFFKLKDLL